MIKRNTTDGNHTIVLRSPITATVLTAAAAVK